MRLAFLCEDNGNNNKYLFNGKELEDVYCLYWGDFGWRRLDLQLGCWMTVDPADEFHSPYVYCGNNPVNYFDPDGAEIEPVMTDLDLLIESIRYFDNIRLIREILKPRQKVIVYWFLSYL